MLAFEHLVHKLLEYLGARVVALVDAVTKTGKTERVVLVLGLVHHLFDRHATLLDAEERFEHGLVCTAMERAPQGANACADTCVQVSMRAAHHTHGRGRTVLFVVGVNNQKRVQRLFHNRIRMVGTGLAAEHHVQEVAAVAAFRFGVHERFTDACLVREGGNRADLRNQACGREVEHVGDVFVVVETRRKQAHGVHDGAQNTHRVGTRRHLPKEVQKVFVEE